MELDRLFNPVTMKFCEQTLNGAIKHPADTWTNVGPFLVGIAILRIAKKPLERLLGTSVLWTGVASAYFHASNTVLGESLDLSGMFMFILTLAAFQQNRVIPQIGNRILFSAVILTFKPNKPLIKDRTYTVTVTTAVKDLAGNGLDEARSWTFSTVGRTWRTSHKLETNDSGYAADSRIVVDAGGSAIAVWNQRVNAVEGIWKNHYTPGSGWGTPELLHSTALGSVYPAIAISDDGDAMVVWISAVGSDKDVFASHYKKGGAWSTPEMIETTVGTADDPSVVAAPDGVFFAAWSDNDGSSTKIYANRFDGNGWGAAQRIDSGNNADCEDAFLTADKEGNVTVLWSQEDVAGKYI